jgi:phosphoribosylamine--glycine ligase
MNILLLTGNGREHALAATYAKSKKVKKVIMIPGNGLTELSSPKIKNYPDIDVWNFKKIFEICKKEHIDLVDVSQDDIIAAGYVDKFTKAGIKTFGPTQKASQLEWDKAWAREFMKKYNLPIPTFETFTDSKKAITYIQKHPEQILFIKAAGLAAGKGVIKAENKKQAIDAIRDMKQFGKSGETFVIEQNLEGEEFSFFALCDGESYKILGAAQDHKTVYNHNQGLNTGGMGCVSNPEIITPKIIKEIEEKILKPLLSGMQKEERPYVGILYLGGMLTQTGVKIIEFNARLGDPEAEVLLPAFQNDYVDIIMAVLQKKLSQLKLVFDQKKRISIAGCAFGYPNDSTTVKGKEIFGIPDVVKIKGVTMFGAGIIKKGNRFWVNGGRIFHLTAEGKTIVDARALAYQGMSMVYIEGNNLHFRTDIGWKEMERFFQ